MRYFNHSYSKKIQTIFLLSVGLFSACSGRIKESERSAQKLDPTLFSLIEGKNHFLIFGAGWCKPCREEVGKFNSLYLEFKNDVKFTSYLVEGAEKSAQPIEKDLSSFQSLNGEFPLYEVKSDEQWQRYSIVNPLSERSIPFIALINVKGELVAGVDLGKNPDLNLRQTLIRLVSGNPVPIDTPSEKPTPTLPPNTLSKTLKVGDWLADESLKPSDELLKNFTTSYKMGLEKYSWDEEEMPFLKGKVTFTVEDETGDGHYKDQRVKMGFFKSDTCDLRVYVNDDGTFLSANGVCHS